MKQENLTRPPWIHSDTIRDEAVLMIQSTFVANILVKFQRL